MVKIHCFIYILLLSFINGEKLQFTNNKDHQINLKWIKSYPNDSLEKAIEGLQWTLSYTGATDLKGLSIQTNENIITLDVSKIGQTENAVTAMEKLHKAIKKSEEYKRNGSVDLGRYVALLIGSSEHYYAIIGTPKKLDDILAKYTLKTETAYINNSSVAKQHRKISFSEQYGFNQLFVATEIDSLTKEILEYETIESLPNGQLRFGVFDANGNRMNTAKTSHTNAGKPGKCIWCHESSFMPLHAVQKTYDGYLSYPDLRSTLEQYMKANNELKLTLDNGIKYGIYPHQFNVDLLYIAFMEPSAERLSLEWGIPVEDVKNKLKDFPTHTYGEFPFLGNLYHRKDVNAFAPFTGLEVSGSVREPSETEVNHLN